MKITIDLLETVENLNMHLEEALVLLMMVDGRMPLKVYKPGKRTWQALERQGYVVVGDAGRAITQAGLKIVNTLTPTKEVFVHESEYQRMWEEFDSIYPTQYGNRMLKGDALECKDLYKAIIVQEGRSAHEKMIRGLQKEIALRDAAMANDEFVESPRALKKWLSSRHWEVFESIL